MLVLLGIAVVMAVYLAYSLIFPERF
ncbi:MAG: potassium-transporting ATPase subunit F [Clostridia bacterium]